MGNRIYPVSLSVLKKNILLIVLFVASLMLAIVLKEPMRRLPALVDWKTIATLTGLLLITTAIKESGLFYLAAYRISCRIDNERILALFLVVLSGTLAMFLTNDIALFITIPLTLSLQQISGNDYGKMVVFEAMAVNVGSSLTAIGNPQNIFLWHKWGISFFVFIMKMAPLVLVMIVWLFIFALISFPSAKIKLTNCQHPVVDQRLFFLSVMLLIAFILFTELKIEEYFLPIVFACLLFFRKKAVLKADWGLIFLFIFLFIDLQLVYQLNIIQRWLALLNLNEPHKLLLSGALLSQGISNVPSAILLGNYPSNFKIIAYGVNIGGNGLLIGSFANLIALRFIGGRSNYIMFHVYSLPFFIITLVSTYCLLV